MWHVVLVDRLGSVVRELAERKSYRAAVALAAGYGSSAEGVAVVTQDPAPAEALEFYMLTDEIDGESITDVEGEREKAAKLAVEAGYKLTHCRLSLGELIGAIGGVKGAGLSLIDSHGVDAVAERWGANVDPSEFYHSLLFSRLTESERLDQLESIEQVLADRGKTMTEILQEIE
jgi:hypothetical protein